MPKNPNLFDQLVMDQAAALFGDVLERPGDIEVALCPVIETKRQMDAATNAALQLPGRRNRWQILFREAVSQSLRVLDSATLAMTVGDHDDDVIAAALTHSLHVGRQFGKLGAIEHPKSTEIGDAICLRAMHANPTEWFGYDAEQPLLDFTPYAKARMKPYQLPTRGCSALSVTAEAADRRVSFFDAHWQFFSESYVELCLYGDLPAYEATDVIAAPSLL